MIKDIRIGTGYDVHRLVKGQKFILGGVEINHPKGLAGHSDADVLLHAITDALLGALALGDIGTYFPDEDDAYKDIDSRKLLRKGVHIIYSRDWEVGNIDSIIATQKPKLAPYIEEMRSNIAEDLRVDIGSISIKATTTEGLGFEGREEGVSASASALVYKG